MQFLTCKIHKLVAGHAFPVSQRLVVMSWATLLPLGDKKVTVSAFPGTGWENDQVFPKYWSDSQYQIYIYLHIWHA